MSFEMGSSLKCFITIFLIAYMVSVLAVPFSHMSIEMRKLFKEYVAYLTSLILLFVHFS